MDARDGNLRKAVHWSSDSMRGRKISFSVHSSPFGLEIPRVTPIESGEYHCRVDFLNSPTRNVRVTLHVAGNLTLICKKGSLKIIHDENFFSNIWIIKWTACVKLL